jgi:potassium-transporting ATPase KdpC subunit
MKAILTACRVFILFTILTGILYPALITALAQILFYNKAHGSLIFKNNSPIGSKLIGQQFDSVIYFSSRPSAIQYNPLPSGGSNFGLTHAGYSNQVMNRKDQFVKSNELENPQDVPSEMIFSSASGLDPDISPQAAFLQVSRIAKARGFTDQQRLQLEEIVKNHTEEPQFLCFGQKRINVLLLNLETDKIK